MTKIRLTTVVVSFIALFLVWIAVGAIGAEGGSYWHTVVAIDLVAAALLALALWWRDTAPRRSTVLIIIGAAAPMVTFYWMAPLFLPLWLAVSALAVVSEPGRRQPVAAA